MRHTKEKVDHILGWILVVLMGLSVINVLWQVFTRFVMNSPSSFTEELARYLLIWVGILGAGYGVGQRVHLALDLLPQKLTGEKRQILGLVIEACVLLFAVFVMIVGGLRLMYVQLMLGQTSAALQLPLGYVYSVVPLSGFVMVYYSLIHIGRQLEQIKEDKAEFPEEEEYVGADKDLHVG